MDRIYCGSAQPHKIRTDETNIAIPTVPNPNVTKLSCHGGALWPTPVIGDRLLAPTTAANVVMIGIMAQTPQEI
jgi:hypothetical protein